jgi:methionyl aminopeptidase
MSLKPRTKEQLELMRISGEITAKALKKVLAAVKDGVSLKQLDDIAQAEIKGLGGEISFQTVDDYQWATCLTLNDEVVHGIPRNITIKTGDKLSIDIGALYKGWHTDAAWSVIVGKEPSLFLMAGEKALWQAINQAVDGNRVGDISQALQTTIEGAGCSVVRTLVGHGVGRELHEDPQIPGIGKKDTGPLLKAGQTIAIEAIYTEGRHEVVTDKDGWTIRTKDGSLGGLFEMSVIVGKERAEVLTDWRKY